MKGKYGGAAALLLLLLVAVHSAHGLYFMIQEGTERCFLEEVPENTLIIGHYKNPDIKNVEDLKLMINIYSPRNELLMENIAEVEGRFALTSLMSGEYRICLKTATSSWFSGRNLKFHLRIDVGESAMDYEELAKSEHLNAIEVEIRKLVDKSKDIRSEQMYQREREEAFRDTSESTNSRVMWWSIFQTLVLLISGFWQIQYLKSFFVAKKLV